MPVVNTPPRVVVLLATFNGLRWLPEQLDSILSQQGVSLRVVALDDESTDGTYEWMVERAASEERLTVLPRRGASGGSAANFYRLIRQTDPNDDELVAFADQDDVWHQGKLKRHSAILREGRHDGVSSSVMSFDEKGTKSLVRKDFPQRRFDFLFESPGPGSTFLITPRLLRLTAATLEDTPEAPAVEFHDSLIYAIARSRGWTWHIDGEPSVDYRQHGDNVMGSNVGLRPALARLRLIRERWLRNHAVRLTCVALAVSPPQGRAELEVLHDLFTSRSIRSRLTLALRARELRRRPRDQRIIALLIAIGIW